MEIKIGDIVKQGNPARFVCYRDGDLWYEAEYTFPLTRMQAYFEFPVPIKDTGTGIFEAEMKAVTLMRWIRKQLEAKARGEA